MSSQHARALGQVLAWGSLLVLLQHCFPQWRWESGLLAGAAGTGAAAGALAGHAVGGVSRGNLKELGELLDPGEAGLVVIAETDVGARVGNAITSAVKVLRKEMKADQKALETELKEIAKE